MLEYLLLLVGLLRTLTRTHADLVAENLLLRQQLAILTRPTRKRSPLRTSDRLFWVLVRLVRGDWRQHLVVVKPQTVVRWHRRAWRLFWRWRSRGLTGRPRVGAEVRQLIARMARDNPAWGAERIRGELLKLGIAVSRGSIQRYRGRGPARPPNQSWRTFLRNHRPTILGGRPADGADADLSDAVRAGLRQPRSAGAPALQRDGQPDGRLGL